MGLFDNIIFNFFNILENMLEQQHKKLYSKQNWRLLWI